MKILCSYSTQFPEDMKVKYYIYCDDQMFAEFNSEASAIAKAKELCSQFKTVEVEQHIWESNEKYNSRKEADEINVIWSN